MVHKISKHINVYQKLEAVLLYYAVQQKTLSLEEIIRYSTVPLETSSCRGFLDKMEERHAVVFDQITETYTLPEYTELFTIADKRVSETRHKLGTLRICVWLLRKIPTLRFVAVTGSCGIENAKVDDDIDLFIVASPGRLFLTRMISMCCVQICGLRRKRGVVLDPDKLCMNLWFDASDLQVPVVKRSLYTARELAQMTVIHDRDDIYSQIQDQNKWVRDFLPNYVIAPRTHASISSEKHASLANVLLSQIDRLAKAIQMNHIKLYRTREYITDTQLWFHPIDRAKMIAMSGSIVTSDQATVRYNLSENEKHLS